MKQVTFSKKINIIIFVISFSLLLLGMVLLISGFNIENQPSVSMDDPNWFEIESSRMDKSSNLMFIAMFILFLGGAALIISITYASKSKNGNFSNEDMLDNIDDEKSFISIECKYCGAIYNENSLTCPYCGRNNDI